MNKDFKLWDGSVVDLVTNSSGVKVVDGSADITTSGVFSYIKNCYDRLLTDYLTKEDEIDIIHLGCGMGYDLLYVDHLFKYKNININKLVGIDLTDYKDIMVDTGLFNFPIEFYRIDVMEYLNSITLDNNSNKKVVVFIDLFLKGNSPIELVYDKKLWTNIVDSINPTYIIVNRCSGNCTLDSIKDSINFKHYDKWSYSLEFYELKIGDTEDE